VEKNGEKVTMQQGEGECVISRAKFKRLGTKEKGESGFEKF